MQNSPSVLKVVKNTYILLSIQLLKTKQLTINTLNFEIILINSEENRLLKKRMFFVVHIQFYIWSVQENPASGPVETKKIITEKNL